MGKVPVGCQTITWGEYRWGHLEETLAGVSQAGYDGVEIGARFLDLDEPDIFQELLKRYNLTLAGLHFGVRWYDPQAVDEAKPQLTRIVDFLVALGCGDLIVSGGERKEGMEPDDYRRQAEALDEVGRHCRERGVKLHYHNHGWEVRNDCEGLRRICELSDPKNVSLALDLGNVVIPGGGNPEEVVREFSDRIGYLHLKDVRGDEFVPVGRGEIDFPTIFSILGEKGFKGWIVVENEVELGEMTPVECIGISRKYLKDALGL